MMTRKKTKTFLRNSLPLILITLSMNAHALVDYSEPVNDPSPSKSAPAAKAPTTASRPMSSASVGGSRSSLIWKSDLSLTTNYEALQIDGNKFGVINLNTHVQTPFNVYGDLTYWQANGTVNGKRGSQSGNPKVLLGFNWLRFGSPADEARFDFYSGAKFSGSSDLASSRTDKIFGVETTKRFGTFGLGLGYDITLPGNPAKNEDMSLGNIHRITVSGGWMVSNDIQFEIEAENFTVGKAADSSRANYLAKDVTFSTLSPKLNLTIMPAVNLEMGARFRMKKPKSDQDLASAKLFDLHGAYSNSLFAGLSFNI